MPEDLLRTLKQYGVGSLEPIQATESLPQRIIDRITAWRLDRKLGTLLSLGKRRIQDIASWNANEAGACLSLADSKLEKLQNWAGSHWNGFTGQVSSNLSIVDLTPGFDLFSASMVAGAGVTRPVRTRRGVAAGSQSSRVLTPDTPTSAGGATASVSGPSAAATPDFDVPDDIDPLASEYRITFQIDDPSGVGSVTLEKGDNRNTVQFGGGCRDATCRTTATLLVDSPITGALETVTGRKATITARDVHENVDEGEYFTSNVTANWRRKSQTRS